jgi:hypothetical protein
MGAFPMLAADVARVSTATMFDSEDARLDQVCEAAMLGPAVDDELERLKTLDWKSCEATRARLNRRVAGEIAAAIAGYSPSMAA